VDIIEKAEKALQKGIMRSVRGAARAVRGCGSNEGNRTGGEFCSNRCTNKPAVCVVVGSASLCGPDNARSAPAFAAVVARCRKMDKTTMF